MQQGLAGRVLGAIHEDEVRRAAHFNQPAVELADTRRIAGGKTEHQLGADFGQLDSNATMRRTPSGCTPEPAGPSVGF